MTTDEQIGYISRWTCGLGCADPIEARSLEDVDAHLRLIHPDVYGDGPERWPDGQIVVYEDPDDAP